MTPNWMELTFAWIQRKGPGPGAAVAPGLVPAEGPDHPPGRGPTPHAVPDPGTARVDPGLVPGPKLYTVQMLVAGYFKRKIF